MNATRRYVLLAALFVLGPNLINCADEVQPVERNLTLRVYNAQGGEGFPTALLEQIWNVRVRVYQQTHEQKSLVYDFREPSGRLPQLGFGENYQIVVEALDQDDEVLADGATPTFDFLPESSFDQIQVFVSRHNSIEYASALFRTPTGVVSAPSEFEGPDVASRLGLDPEAFGGQRAGHTVTELPDGQLLVVGGARLTNDAGNPFAHFIDTIELYNPFTGYWTLVRDRDVLPIESAGATEAAPMRLSVPRAFHTATIMGDGRIVIAGGFYRNDTLIDTSTAVEIIDLRKGTIQVLTPNAQDLLDPRAMHTAHWINGMVVVIGGVSRTFDRPNFLDSIEAFDPDSVYFERLEDPDGGGTDLLLQVGRGLHTGTTLPDGIIVTGGRTNNGVTDTIEFLELKDGALRNFFTDGPRHMATPRFGHAAVWMAADFESTADNPPTYLAIAGGFQAEHPDGDAAMTLLSGANISNQVEFFDTWDLASNGDITVQMATGRAHFQMIETSITRDLMVFGGIVANGDTTAVTDTSERLFRTLDGGFPLTVNELDDGMNQARAFAASTSIKTHNAMIIGGWNGGNSAAVCGGATVTSGCTSELANPGDLYNLGYIY